MCIPCLPSSIPHPQHCPRALPCRPLPLPPLHESHEPCNTPPTPDTTGNLTASHNDHANIFPNARNTKDTENDPPHPVPRQHRSISKANGGSACTATASHGPKRKQTTSHGPHANPEANGEHVTNQQPLPNSPPARTPLRPPRQPLGNHTNTHPSHHPSPCEQSHCTHRLTQICTCTNRSRSRDKFSMKYPRPLAGMIPGWFPGLSHPT